MLEQIKARAGTHIVVDLEQQLVIWPDGSGHPFEIDAFRKHCLLQGVDELGYTLGHRADIDAFERDQVATTPWL
jgi:3-isopropylmalate/(R)-2-methylmalate dehydratase small subunit